MYDLLSRTYYLISRYNEILSRYIDFESRMYVRPVYVVCTYYLERTACYIVHTANYHVRTTYQSNDLI